MTEGFTSQEMIGIQKLVGKYGRFSHVHTRFSSQAPPTTALFAFQEAIDPAVAHGGGVIIAHFTAQSLALTEAAMEYVDAMRARGVHVVLEVYPYNFPYVLVNGTLVVKDSKVRKDVFPGRTIRAPIRN